MKRIKVKKINDHIFLMNDNNEATGYLVVGEKRALVIDTMNGYEDVKKEVESITSLPLIVVNTHCHPDHIFGNVYFDNVYIHPDDKERAEYYFTIPEFLTACRRQDLTPAKFSTVEEGDTFNLGNLELEVYHVPGHTAGGICLLDRKDRILFSGDSIIEQTWLQLEDSMPVETAYKSLKNMYSKIRNEFDYILTGHSRDIEDASLCEAHLQALKEVCEGKTENDIPYKWAGGESMQHIYGKEPRRIVYNKNK